MSIPEDVNLIILKLKEMLSKHKEEDHWAVHRSLREAISSLEVYRDIVDTEGGG